MRCIFHFDHPNSPVTFECPENGLLQNLANNIISQIIHRHFDFYLPLQVEGLRGQFIGKFYVMSSLQLVRYQRDLWLAQEGVRFLKL